MSNSLEIQFAADLPTMAVDVVGSDLTVEKTVMMRADEKLVLPDEPSGSFLRVHLPSGRSVMLRASELPQRLVTLDSLGVVTKLAPKEAAPEALPGAALGPVFSYVPSKRSIRREQVGRGSLAEVSTRAPSFFVTYEATLGLGGYASVWDEKNKRVPVQTIDVNQAEWPLHGFPTRSPFTLHVLAPDGRELVVCLPGNIERVRLRVDEVGGNTLLYSVRAQSSASNADTISNYVCRGDFDSAQAMAQWVVGESSWYLEQKYNDPYAAAVGAYLLLRLKRLDDLHDWPKNLANGFPYLPDGCVLWASQLLEQDPLREGDIRHYLLQAAQRGLPVNTAGLRLLLDGLALLGADGCQALKEVRAKIGQVIWESPLTAFVRPPAAAHAAPARRVMFDIEFSAQA